MATTSNGEANKGKHLSLSLFILSISLSLSLSVLSLDFFSVSSHQRAQDFRSRCCLGILWICYFLMASVCGDDEARSSSSSSSSACPSCLRGFDLALILPCSHTLCGRCLAEGAGLVRRGGVSSASRPVCAVLCPNCRHCVELPCFDWSSALTCLPFDPTVTPDPEASGAQEERRWETGECSGILRTAWTIISSYTGNIYSRSHMDELLHTQTPL